MFAHFSPGKLLILLAIVLLLVGGKKLPELAEGLGNALKKFKDTQKDDVEIDNKTEASAPAKEQEPKA